MGRQSGYLEGKTLAQTPDPTTRLAEALLGADMCKTPRALLIKFDEPRDARIAHQTLVGLRDAYTPPRK
jgi:hypothetical protein